jgi:hypothetical protein
MYFQFAQRVHCIIDMKLCQCKSAKLSLASNFSIPYSALRDIINMHCSQFVNAAAERSYQVGYHTKARNVWY